MEEAKRHSDDNSLVAPPIPMSERGGLQPIQPVTTDQRGQATVRLTATDPGNPRGYIDGQVYNVDYGPEYSSGSGTVMLKEDQLNVLVWDEYKEPADIAWIPDVKPILQQYANLYPVMRDVLDLANYHDVVKYKHRLQHVLTEPMDSPSHMPVTRDLSPGKRDAIVRWLRQERPPSWRSGTSMTCATHSSSPSNLSTPPFRRTCTRCSPSSPAVTARWPRSSGAW